jgi:heat shock protein HtpX
MPITANPAFEPLLIMNNLRGGLAGLFSTHPATDARVKHLLKLEQEMDGATRSLSRF